MSLAFVQGIHRGLVNSPHKWPVTRKKFPFDDVIYEFLWSFLECYQYSLWRYIKLVNLNLNLCVDVINYPYNIHDGFVTIYAD